MSMVSAGGVSRVEFRLLGPVEVWIGGRRLDAGQPRQRAVLAALLVDAGRMVPIDTLIDRVWGEEIPDQARVTLRAHLSRIRRLLEQADECGAPGASLSRVPGGYLLRVDSDQIDLHRFRRLAGTDSPVESLLAALALWQGQPLAGLEGEWAGRMRELWSRERVDAAVRWARAELAQANPGPVLTGLAELAADNPLVGPLTEVLMLALHAAGRTSEALELYARTRAQLAEQLGTDPGPDLQALHLSLLRGELAATPTAGPSPSVPRQLPGPPQLFTGRQMELAELNKIHDASTVVITAIDGMAGVGKTALAVQAAHQMVDRYPDGQLFIDLHGYTEGVAPVEPGEALDSLLRSLGVPGERIPADVDQRAGLYRSRLAERRMVIVLDNATTEAQVRPLLPGAPGCVVLVTSRRRLAGLDHTHALSLDTLPLPDAVALLRHSVGDHRLAGQPPELSAELVELCGRLPLAIRIAAARLRSHPAWDLGHLVRRLRDQQHRLVELQAGQRSVTAALDLSYQDLDANQQRTYRLLGLHTGADIDAYAAAALLDATLLDASRLLEQLLDAHLLQEPIPGRYRFHDLTRAHAAQHVAGPETQQPMDRLLDYYRHTAVVAMDAAYPYERGRRPQVPPARTPRPDLSDPLVALDWLDNEMPNLLAAASYAAEHNQPAHLLHLSSILHRHLRTRGPYHDAETLHQQALTTARATGDHAAEMEALTGLGHMHRLQGRYEQATDHYQQALQLARANDHQAAELQALNGVGVVHQMQGRLEQATEHFEQALRLARAIGDRTAELDALVGLCQIHVTQNRYEQGGSLYQETALLARAAGHQAAELYSLSGLAWVHLRQGRYEQAIDYYQQALRPARATGNRTGELQALTGLGWVHRVQGRFEQATDVYRQALQLARATGHREAEQNALAGLGDIDRVQGRYDQATEHYQRLLDLSHQSGNRNWQFEAKLGLGRVHHATGHPDLAVDEHDQALALATELAQPEDEIRAHDGLAHAHDALQQTEHARAHWQRALEMLTQLGLEHTEDEETTVAAIRAHLAGAAEA
jgi:tetratricopeptide (TPR) repeat protein/DNA-binding SARP family transcriptional activator